VSGHLESIFLAPAAKAPLIGVPEVHAVADRGLEGDRYFHTSGSFSRWPGEGRAVTLIEAEAIEAVGREAGIDLTAGRSRRNLLTRGVRLADLNGRRFRIGQALFRGTRVCEPCAFLERLTEPGAFAALKGRGGLRADVLEGGIIRAGDAIVADP
jgi:MOSC domain-containing protein YiiM